MPTLQTLRGAALLVAVVALAPGAAAQTVDYAGTSAANFLKIPVGARGMALGGADVARAEDASGLFWNPGTLPQLGQNNATFSYTPWLIDTSVAYAGVAVKALGGTVGLDLHSFQSGDIEETTLAEQDGTGRFVSASDFAVGVAYARGLTDRFSVGAKVKLVNESLAGVNASGIGLDVGAVFRTNVLSDLQLAFVLANFGSRMQFAGRDLQIVVPVPDNPEGASVPAEYQTGEWDLPMTFRIGASTDVLRTADVRVRASYSVTDTRDAELQHLLGGEAVLMDLVSLRGGFTVRDDGNLFSLGGGVALPAVGRTSLRADYAFARQPYGGDAQQITLSATF